jgi:hypothetical protein
MVITNQVLAMAKISNFLSLRALDYAPSAVVFRSRFGHFCLLLRAFHAAKESM